MPKLTKRTIDALACEAKRDVFLWDSEVRGFGVRAKPSGTKTFIIQYRNGERRTRRFVIGQYGVLSVEIARDLAKKKLADVIDGGSGADVIEGAGGSDTLTGGTGTDSFRYFGAVANGVDTIASWAFNPFTRL